MKTNYMDKVCTVLIKKCNYRPIINNDGNQVQYEGMRIVHKVLENRFIIVELLDADLMSKEQIAGKLEHNRNNLERMGSPSVYTFEVFIFNCEPDEEKLQSIKEGQMENIHINKYLQCISVQMQSREVKKLYDNPIQTEGLEEALKLVLEADSEDIDFEVDINIDSDTQNVVNTKEIDGIFKRVPYVTYCLLAINIAIWLIMNIYAYIKGIDVGNLFLPFGAKENFRIMSGEYWRFITPIFLHADFQHLMANSLSLFVFGRVVEGIYGHKKFAAIYFIAGIIGNIASFMFSTSSGVGASGAIFGLFGALLYLAVENPYVFKRTFGNSLIIMIVFNLVYGFMNPGIDNFAHVGGLIGGFLASGIVTLRGIYNKLLSRAIFIVVTGIVVIGGLYYGFNNSRNIEYQRQYILSDKYVELKQFAQEDKWAEVERLGEEIIQMEPADYDMKWLVLYNVSVAEAYQNKYNEAIETAKLLKDTNAPKGYYLTGLLYLDTQQYQLALVELKEAAKLNPEIKGEIEQYIEEIENQLR